MLDIQVVADVAQWRNAGDRLERLGNGRLERAIEQAIETSAAPLPKRARDEALRRLPKRGGLAGIVARTDMPIIARFTGRRRGVLIPARPGAVKDPSSINRGRLAHPTFGRWSKPPVIQQVRAGWFTDPMLAGRGEVREAILSAVREEFDRAVSGG